MQSNPPLSLLEASKHTLQAVIDGITDRILVVDRSYRIKVANKTAASNSGQSVQDLIGKQCHVEQFRQVRPCADCLTRRCFEIGRPETSLKVWTGKDGVRRAVPPGGEIGLRTCVDSVNKRLVAAVADAGPGIPPEYLEKIFDPFFSTKPQGTGLGLAISRRIIAAYLAIQRPASGPVGAGERVSTTGL